MTNKLNKSISEIWEDEYVIPLYQRNYAWQEDQIQQLLQDIYDNYSRDSDSHYFIGSLIVLQRPDNVYEVIDGQQRLTTLHLICKSLGLLNTPHLSYDSRPEVEEFFKGLFASATSQDFANECKKRDCRKIFRLVDALDIVETTPIHSDEGPDSTISLSKMDKSTKQAFGKYLNNNVIIVRTVLPSDTDVASYFEIMNNRGEQLQEHEIVKALMMGKLEQQNRSVFSIVWDACSQMNVPIQKGLSTYRHNQDKPLFGEKYDELLIDYLDKYNEQTGLSKKKSIAEVLQEKVENSCTQEEGKEIDDKYNSIIDFPNFLMHVFKIFSKDCPLSSNVILEEYRKIEQEVDPMEFIKVLLKVRVLFDRYIIKSKDDAEDDESIKWIMHKPYKYTDNSLRFKNTYSEEEKEDIEDKLQKRIIMQESMLQVTFRNKKYKNWLFELLKEFKDSDVNNITPSLLSEFLDKWIINYYNALEENNQTENTAWAFESLGTDTPHFIFNFIDYLYWVAKEKNIDIPGCKDVEDFVFKYYNSIEHHLPQSYNNINVKEEEKRKVVDNIANLCLISRSTNSSLNDKSPTEKAKIEPGLSPKRKIMYQMTNDHNKWDKEEINEHYKNIEELISKREILLAK